MSRAKSFTGPDFRDPQQRPAAVAGLSMRQKRNEAIGRSTLLPVFRPVQVVDQLRGERRG